jgi:hypothetical protein
MPLAVRNRKNVFLEQVAIHYSQFAIRNSESVIVSDMANENLTTPLLPFAFWWPSHDLVDLSDFVDCKVWSRADRHATSSHE